MLSPARVSIQASWGLAWTAWVAVQVECAGVIPTDLPCRPPHSQDAAKKTSLNPLDLWRPAAPHGCSTGRLVLSVIGALGQAEREGAHRQSRAKTSVYGWCAPRPVQATRSINPNLTRLYTKSKVATPGEKSNCTPFGALRRAKRNHSGETHAQDAQQYACVCVMLITATPASANVITDWDTTGVALIQGNAPSPPPRVGGPTGGMRIVALMHIAMFEAVNGIEPRYQPFNGDPKPKVGASQDAAAASAAATVLAELDPEDAPKVKEALDKSLAGIPNGDAKDRGIKLGEESATEVIELPSKTDTTAPNAFRPITQPGVYTETMVTAGWDLMTMTPFAMNKS